mgnify:CR=1
MLQPDINILLRAKGYLAHEPSRKPNSSGLKGIPCNHENIKLKLENLQAFGSGIYCYRI